MKFKNYENVEEIKKDISLAGDKVIYRLIQAVMFQGYIYIVFAFTYFIYKIFPVNNNLSIIIFLSSFLIILITYIIVFGSMLLNSLSSYIHLVIKLKRWKNQSH